MKLALSHGHEIPVLVYDIDNRARLLVDGMTITV